MCNNGQIRKLIGWTKGDINQRKSELFHTGGQVQCADDQTAET